jgi:hypothetical protein
MRYLSLQLISFFLICIILADCCKNEPKPTVTKTSQDATNGVFKLRFGEPKTDDERRAMNTVKTQVEEVVKNLNSRIGLPHDISIIFSSENPSGFSPIYSFGALSGISVEGERGRFIAFPYAFIKLVSDTLQRAKFSAEDVIKGTIGTTSMLLVHEASHALIDVLDLPVLGREEDAADSGSAVFLTGLQNGGSIVAYSADFWNAFGKQRGLDSTSFADEHGLDLQRAYNLICWTYGRNTSAYNALRKYLTDARAPRCQNEYRKLANSWDEVMHKHLKKDF